MKDFFDLWFLARQFDFDGRETTAIELEPVALTPEFTTSATTQKPWAAFVRRTRLPGPTSLEEIRQPLRRFLLPVAERISTGMELESRWIASRFDWEALGRG